MKPAQRDLPKFVRMEQGKRVALVHPDFIPAVSNALLDGQGVQPTGVGGRGELQKVASGQGDVLIRKYWRGGMIARVLKDTYLLNIRPLKELRVHIHAWRNGVPTVMPVGAMWERSGLFYRGAFATLRASGEDLLQYLQSRAVPEAAVLANCGHAIFVMHRAGIYHADLQVKNILVEEETALVIDFDGARMKEVTQAMAERNLARLKRSFIKRSLPLKAFDAIASAYLDSKNQHRDTKVTEE